ncbi:hypothetical protein [Micromonospora sp. CPCC 206061]
MRAGTNPATEVLGEHGYRLLAAETATAAGHAPATTGLAVGTANQCDPPL